MIKYHYHSCQACPSIPYLRYDGVEAAVSGRLETGESPTSPAPTSPSSTWSPSQLSARGRTTVLLCLFGKKICGRNVIATVWADIMGELSQDNLFHLHPPVEYVAVKTLTNQTCRLHLDISRKNYSFSCIHFILIGYQYFG